MRAMIRACIWAAAALATPALAAGNPFAKVDAIFKRTPTRAGDVYRYGFPRSDLEVTIDGVKIDPALALAGWVGFAFPSASQPSMAMGDLVLAEAEVEPAMRILLAGGIEVTALHNLPRATPPTYEMHIVSRGDPAELAKTIRSALEQTKTPLDVARIMPKSNLSPAQPLDVARIERVIGAKGRVNGAVYQFQAPDEVASSYDGMSVPAAMGAAASINFQPSGPGKAVVIGELPAQAKEVDVVVGELLAHGVEVTAIHNHMLSEEPRLFFVHFYAKDDALLAAEAVRSALDRIAAKRKPAKAASD